MRYHKKFSKWLISVSLLIIVAAGLLYKGFIRFNYPSLNKYPIRGIDVSHHQKQINWAEIKKQSIQFAFIKATEGSDFKDKNFLKNCKGATSVGIDVGAYHFFTFCSSGRSQAKNFIETVPKQFTSLPPVVDLEFGGNCKNQKNNLTILAEIDTLLTIIESEYDKKPILYVTKEFYQRFLINQFPENPIWIRNIYQEPILIDNRSWLFWQFANRGNLKGIDTYVDLNVFNGTNKEYQKIKN